MRILLVTNSIKTNSLDLMRFRDFADIHEIDVKNSFESGKEYIQNYLIEKKKHLDFIVVSRQAKKNIWDYDYREEDINEFAIWLRNLPETYSSDNFQIKSIPIILDDEETYHRRISIASFKNKHYDLITNLKSIGDNILLHVLGKPINDWLNKLGDELDNADLDTEFIFEKSLISKKDTFDVKILAQSFFKRYAKLNYIWIGDNIKKLYVDADLFRLMLNKSSKNRKLRNEKEYHNFLLNNQGLLIGDQFHSTVYENHFYYKNSRKYVEPDFVNLSHAYSFKFPEVFEVKLPNQKLINSQTKNVSRYLRKSIIQSGIKYPDYFSNSINHFQINKGLGYVPSKFDFTLLIGRLEDKEENIEIINNHVNSKDLRLNIITYDELMSKYQMTYNRVKRFNLK